MGLGEVSRASALPKPSLNMARTTSRLLEVCHDCARLVDRFLEDTNDSELRTNTQKQVRLSISIIEKTLSRHSLDEIAISFNGGKDCLVMLIIFLACLYQRYTDQGESTQIQDLEALPCVYVQGDHAFPEVEGFIKECNVKYCLDTVKYSLSLKESFAQYLVSRPAIKTILVGIRRADPYAATLDYVQTTDHGWPDFLRVHPVLEWHYVEVWDFLLTSKVKYCPLYDLGYTSLGGQNNTARNPCLETEETDAEGTHVYLPAYRLHDDDKERLGRLQ